MELMEILKSRAFTQWIAESLVVFFLVGGFVVFAVGLGLSLRTEGTLQLFDTMNRWVSMRRASRPLEVARDTQPLVRKYRRGLAAIFVAGGLYALYGLATQFNPASVIHVFSLNFLKPVYASWVVESARWILIVGNAAAIGIGIALAVFPGWVEALEARGSRWYSARRAARGADDLRLPLDQKVTAYPRASGVIMMFFGLVLVFTFGLKLFGR